MSTHIDTNEILSNDIFRVEKFKGILRTWNLLVSPAAELIGFCPSFNRRVIPNGQVLDEIILSFINSAQTGAAAIYFPMSCRYSLNPVCKRTSYRYFFPLAPPPQQSPSTRPSSRLMWNVEKQKKRNTVHEVGKRAGIVITVAWFVFYFCWTWFRLASHLCVHGTRLPPILSNIACLLHSQSFNSNIYYVTCKLIKCLKNIITRNSV